MNCSMTSLVVIYLVGEKVSINAYQADRERNPPSQIQQSPLSFRFRLTPSPCQSRIPCCCPRTACLFWAEGLDVA